MEVVGRSWYVANGASPGGAGLYVSHSREMYYHDNFGCINSSTGYHFVPFEDNPRYILAGSAYADPHYPGSGPGAFYCDWWGYDTRIHPSVGCLNSPNYYLQQELSSWR